MRYRAIFLDCFRTIFDVGPAAPMMRAEEDGWWEALESVLADAAPLVPGLQRESFLKVFERVTRFYRHQAVTSGREHPVTERFEAALERFADLSAQRQRYASLLAEVQGRHIVTHCRPFPGAGDVLCTLSHRFPLALVSNFDDARAVRELLARHQLEGFFSAVLVSVEVGWRKPRPEMFHAALTAVGVPAEAALFVGDNWQEDILGAAAIGMETVWVNPRAAAPGLLQRAPRGWVIREIRELCALDCLRAG